MLAGHQADERADAVAGKPVPAIERLARAATLEAGQAAYQSAAEAQGVTGWTRRTDVDPCPLCASLAGPTLPIRQRMITHPHCNCTPEIVLDDVGIARQLEERGAGARLTTGAGLGRTSHHLIRPGVRVSRSAPTIERKP